MEIVIVTALFMNEEADPPYKIEHVLHLDAEMGDYSNLVV